MADETIEARLLLLGDSKPAIKSIDEMRRSFSVANKEFVKISDNLRTGFEASRRVIAESTKELSNFEAEARRAARAQDDLNKAGSGKANVGALLSKGAQAAGAAGLGGAQSALSAIDDITGLIDEVGQTAIRIAPGLGGLVANLAAVAGPLAVAGGLFAVFLNNITESNKKLSESIAAENRTRAEVQREIAGGLTTDQAKARVEELKRLLAAEQQILSENEAAQNRAFEAAQAQLGDFLGRLAYSRIQVSEEAEQSVTDNIEKASAAIRDYGAELATLESALNEGATALGDSLEAEKQRTEAIKKAEDELAQTRLRVQATVSALDDQLKQLNKSYEEQRARVQAARNLQDARAEEDRSIAARRAQEDLDALLEDQANQHQANLASIEARGAEQIENLRQQSLERQVAAAKQIADLEAKFRADELKATAAFELQRQRQIDDFNRNAARAAEDLRDRLRDLRDERDRAKRSAILENDALAFLEAQSEFEGNRRSTRRDARKDARRAAEDLEASLARALEDFQLERAEQRAALGERINGIKAELAEFQAANAAKIEAIKQQTQDELALAENVYQERLKKDQAARDLINTRAQEDLDLALARLQQDRDAEDAAAKAANESAIAAIEEKKNAELAALSEAETKLLQVRGLDSQLLDAIAAKAQSVFTLLNSLSTGGSTLIPPTMPTVPTLPVGQKPASFDRGGIVPAGVSGLGYFEGLRTEAIIPLDSPRGRNMLTPNIEISFSPQVVPMGGDEYVTYQQYQADLMALKEAWKRASEERDI